MHAILNLTSRNLKVYLRNRTSVFFSFLSVIIVLGLYVLFLGENIVDSVKRTVGEIDGIEFLCNSWLVAGLIAVSTITVALGSLGTLVNDREDKRLVDFIAAPVRTGQIVISYMLSTTVVTLCMSLLGFGAGELLIYLYGGSLISMLGLLKIIGVLLLSTLSGSMFMLLICTLTKTASAFSAVSVIVGTLIGFITGSYIPIGGMPQYVQKAISFFPVSHSASLLRQIIMEKPLEMVFAGAPVQAIESYKKTMGVELYWGDKGISIELMLGILGVSAIVAMMLAVWRFRRVR
jgi:multidrug/hemolysin transport system permease protein